MPDKRRFKRNLLLALTVAGALGAAAALSSDLRWRAVVLGRKATGGLGDVSWIDLVDVLRPGSGFDIVRLAKSGQPYASLTTAAVPAEERAEGKELFSRNCAKCHGPEGAGGMGPRLAGERLKHGDADWAIYRTIRYGIDGTPMQGGLLERRDAWKVVAYLRQLRAAGKAGAEAGAATALPALDITSSDLVHAADTVGRWILPSGAYDGRRYASDAQIDTRNVAELTVSWIHQFAATGNPNESTPIVAGRFLYVAIPPGDLAAIDAATGRQIWHYRHPLPERLHMIWLTTSRGVSVRGRVVYWATPDAHLLALDAASGQLLWDRILADHAEGYSMTSPPLPVDDMVIAGIAGGDYPIRGFIGAYDARTGEPRWRFDTVPGPGEPGNETWGGDSWKFGGAGAWGIGSYDPELGLLYWGIGNPNPDFDSTQRPGDNLYSNCMLALDAKTGRLAWHFQFTPGDDHDWDSIQTPALIDVDDGGTRRKALAVANRNGFFYVLDRRDGSFIRAGAFVKQTWATGFTPRGRPIVREDSRPTTKGVFVFPSYTGATLWWPSAYHPGTGLYYVNAIERGGLYFRNESSPARKAGHQFLGGTGSFVEGEKVEDFVRAIDPATATVRWERKNVSVNLSPRGGLLATAGGIVFGSDSSVIYALDAASGKELWSFDTGGLIAAPPITYRFADRQYIAVVAGSDILAFALPAPAAAPRSARAR